MREARNEKTVKIKQIRSGIGTTKRQKATLKSLKLGKMHRVVELPDNVAVRGMVRSIPHLVKIVEE
ncbi:MAG: 50S ribosomal protein L30 [Acidobacteriota bacterium]